MSKAKAKETRRVLDMTIQRVITNHVSMCMPACDHSKTHLCGAFPENVTACCQYDDHLKVFAGYFHVSTDYLLTGKDHDMAENRTRLLDMVTQLTEIAKRM